MSIKEKEGQSKMTFYVRIGGNKEKKGKHIER